MGALFIISNNNLSMYQPENLSKFSAMYFGWIKELYSNFASMTGYVVRLDWIPQ